MKLDEQQEFNDKKYRAIKAMEALLRKITWQGQACNKANLIHETYKNYGVKQVLEQQLQQWIEEGKVHEEKNKKGELTVMWRFGEAFEQALPERLFP
ncbi:MAG: hypothetical protein CMI54_07810 [Parcubacteria group bacterium]|jgi:hypothetical protein|nr:hypothetical protein [Parcubacteria group bacterium]|tara:strand:+ start:1074 stop:1364 length:291 start_codon:yes stop_codon:yes gene_type:complete